MKKESYIVYLQSFFIQYMVVSWQKGPGELTPRIFVAQAGGRPTSIRNARCHNTPSVLTTIERIYSGAPWKTENQCARGLFSN